jgi:hypothetical protein
VSAAAVQPSLWAGQWFRGKWTVAWGRRLQRLDHAVIFFLIAGPATPLSCSLPAAPSGWSCLIVMWALTGAPPEIRLAWMRAPEVVAGATFVGVRPRGLSRLRLHRRGVPLCRDSAVGRLNRA